MARITGNDGDFSLATFNLVANSWSLTVTPTSTDVTGFGDTGKQMVTGMATFSGSASGFLDKDGSNTDPGLVKSALEGQTGVVCTLTAASGCTWTGDVIMTNSTVNANKNGDTTVSFDFQFIGDVAYAWDES
tara:strand:- start:174 stop:569 length:396 start_codon:yes stop_codon:yes gene_type:complete